MRQLHYFLTLLMTFLLCYHSGVAAAVAKPCREDIEWQCDNGACIDEDKLCDSAIDCGDASDETVEHCVHQTCPTYAFRCAYGACIAGSAACDCERTCADGSDELDIICQKDKHRTKLRGACGENEMQCGSGQCIQIDIMCDGRRDCPDGTDETLEMCADALCPAYTFQCAYGACINAAAKCNNSQDCHDGSDEAATLCSRPRKPTTPPIAVPQQCRIPRIPFNLVVTSYKKRLYAGDTVHSGALISYSCSPGYNLYGAPQTRCIDNSWEHTMPTCRSANCRVAEQITGSQHVRKCEYNGQAIACGDVPIGAQIEVYNLYKNYERILRCNENAQWNLHHPIICWLNKLYTSIYNISQELYELLNIIESKYT